MREWVTRLQQRSDARIVEILHPMMSMGMVRGVHHLVHLLLMLLLLLGMVRMHLLRWRGRRLVIHRHHTLLLNIIHIRPIATIRRLLLLLHTAHRANTIFLILILADTRDGKHLELPADHHPKAFASHWLFDSWDTSPVAPLVDLPAERIGFVLEHPQLARGEHAVAPGSVDMRDGGVDDGGL